ncbi:Unknown protein [Striga hermonthica]|uniref:Uncharacterized protein n=1 Tax=Striga hermonthica TaxID=68872 RepID=A0A9N7P3F3_STRHE|nr:Unknown protein [Striga hermonthica]
MEVSAYKTDGIFAKELEDELMKFTVKSEDNGGVEGPPLVNQTEQVQKNKEVEVNITECTKSMGNKAFIPQHQDLTESESSSSFDDSDSDFEYVDSLGNSEDLSGFCGDIDGFGDDFRKKKLTAHWRSFIQPIMWRCKWTELQIKKLQSLAQKYDRELEAHNKRKQIQIEDSSLADGVKSVPFSRTSATDDLFKRKKRRMKEATTDVAEYMSRHNLFSYYENKKSSTDGASMSNLSKSSEKAAQKANIDEDWANDDLSSFVAGDGDNSLEEILRKIELLQSQAGQLRSRVNRVIQGNAEKFHFVEELDLPMPFEAPNASNGDGIAVGTYIASQLMSEYNTGDIHASESEVTNHGEGVHNANASTDHAPFANSNVEDGALIDNQRVKEEINFEEVIINPSKKPPLKTNGPINTISPQLAGEPNLPANNQSPPKVRSTAPRTKRKRGWKKGVRRKTRRSTG